MTSARYGNLPFAEQIEFFRERVDIPTAAWTDVYGAEHDHAFMAAGARGDVLADMRQAVDRAISEGATLADFRRDFDEIVARTGWAYQGGRNWRTRVIYDTNLRQSYNAGREAQMDDPRTRRARPYGLYRHGGSADPRPEHLAWDGLVLPLDDPWWETHSPQNGWGCSCKKFTLSERDVERMGLEVAERAPPVRYEEKVVGVRGPSPRVVRVPRGIDPGFEHRPGASRRRGPVPPPMDRNTLLPAAPGTRAATDEMPTARPADAEMLMPSGRPDEEYVRAFLAEFGLEGTDRETLFRDVTGEIRPISAELFRGRDGRLKVQKRGRERHVRLIARTIIEPDEVWVSFSETDGQESLRRRYLARWLLPGETVPTIAVFEQGRAGWVGITGLSADDVAYLQRQGRLGERIYRRGE
jgi:hypothetical protein